MEKLLDYINNNQAVNRKKYIKSYKKKILLSYYQCVYTIQEKPLFINNTKLIHIVLPTVKTLIVNKRVTSIIFE